MAGRRAKLTSPEMPRIDAWFAESKKRSLPAKTVAARLGVNVKTLYDAATRRGAYAGWARA